MAAFVCACGTETITNVWTPKDFDAAMKQGAEHIRLRAHMDLRELPLSPLCPEGQCDKLVLFQVANGTDSIQVLSCTSSFIHASAAVESAMGSQLAIGE